MILGRLRKTELPVSEVGLYKPDFRSSEQIVFTSSFNLMPPKKKKAPPDSEPVAAQHEHAKPSKFVFNGTTLNKLITAILRSKPYQDPHREITKMWQTTVDEFNANTNDQNRLTVKTAQEKFKQLLDMHLVRRLH
jgi:hypothetical protein